MNPVRCRSVALAAAIVGAFVLVALPVSAATARTADVSDFSFVSFDGQYYLDTNAEGHATTRVVETIVAEFPDFDQNRGIIRAIPLTYDDTPLNFSMVSVTDESGAAVPFERDDYDGFAELALGTDDYVQGVTTYVIEYTLENTIRHFADSGGDEFYWDINGDGWAQTFGSVSATVHLSDSLADALTGDSSCYLKYLAAELCQIDRQGNELSVRVSDVGPYNTLTVAIGFDGGVVVQPALARDSWIVTVAPQVLLGLALLLVALGIVVRVVLWRDAPGRGTIIAQFDPPEYSSLLLDANIVRRRAAGLPAQLVDFAVRGNLNIVDTAAGTPMTSDRRRFTLELVSADGLNPKELRTLVALFGATLRPGKRVNPGALPADIGAALYALPAYVDGEAVREGLRADPPPAPRTILLRIAFWLVPAFVAIWVWASFNDVLGAGVVLPALATLAAVLVLPVVLSKPKLLTHSGAAARDYLLGIREYLTVAEEDRMRMLQSPEGAERLVAKNSEAIVKLNERLLPYAVLWGVEDEWVEKLRADYGGAVPDWFTGDTFDATVLRGFTRSSTSMVRPIVTSSSSSGGGWSSSGSSSSSSGSSGGGFSGGGGGGGGGGGR